MTLFAFGSKWGFFGASGLTNFDTPSAAMACLAKKSSPSRPARATEAKPPPVCQRNSRRVRPQNCLMVTPRSQALLGNARAGSSASSLYLAAKQSFAPSRSQAELGNEGVGSRRGASIQIHELV